MKPGRVEGCEAGLRGEFEELRRGRCESRSRDMREGEAMSVSRLRFSCRVSGLSPGDGLPRWIWMLTTTHRSTHVAMPRGFLATAAEAMM